MYFATQDGAFDEAVKGIDVIMHVASPCHFDADDPNELTVPAVGGTVGILKSAYKRGESVKRIIFTSSTAAILTSQPQFRVFNDDDWNESSIREVEQKGRAAAPIDKYRASKVHAERAAWAFMQEHKADIKFDFVTIHPSWVLGPTLLATSPQHLKTSMQVWFDTVCKGTKDDKYLATSGYVRPRYMITIRAHRFLHM